MLLALVIVGLTIKFDENLGPFKNGLLSSWEVAGGVLTTDVCMVGITGGGCAEAVCEESGLSMDVPTSGNKVE